METALITGATEGIGYEFTKLFAEKGINLVLVARNETKLSEIASALSAQNISVKTYAKDLSIIENAKYVYNDLKDHKIAIDYLINNAGFGINDEYISTDWESENQMFTLNMITLAYFTKVFAKDMRSRNFGRIVNLGSTGSFAASPYMAGYCATKAFVLSLSESVNHELKGANVSVTALCPGITDTKFDAVANTGTTLFVKLFPHAHPKNVANYGYKIMMKRKAVGIQGAINRLIIFSYRFISRNTLVYLGGKMLKRQLV